MGNEIKGGKCQIFFDGEPLGNPMYLASIEEIDDIEISEGECNMAGKKIGTAEFTICCKLKWSLWAIIRMKIAGLFLPKRKITIDELIAAEKKRFTK